MEAAGRLGLALLGLYFTLAGTLHIASSIVSTAEAPHAGGEAFSYELDVLISIATPYLVGSVLPGLLLLLSRRSLARRLFRGAADVDSIDGPTSVIVGLLLIGVYVAIGGLSGIVYGISGSVMLPAQFSGSFAAEQIRIGIPLAIAQIMIGLSLVRWAPTIARRL